MIVLPFCCNLHLIHTFHFHLKYDYSVLKHISPVPSDYGRMKITRSSRSEAGCPRSWLWDGKHMVPFSELEKGTERTSKNITRAGMDGHTQIHRHTALPHLPAASCRQFLLQGFKRPQTRGIRSANRENWGAEKMTL